MAGRQGVVVVFLVLAAHFESWVHPFVIMFSVSLAIAGALMGLWLSGQSMNIYSEIGLVMLAGLAAKNGILIVELVNQLRDQGREFCEALIEAADVRMRPIVMTGIATRPRARCPCCCLQVPAQRPGPSSGLSSSTASSPRPCSPSSSCTSPTICRPGAPAHRARLSAVWRRSRPRPIVSTMS
jgi:hypothetical protein